MVMVLVRNPIVLIFINFARVSSHFDDFNTCNKVMTAKRLKKDSGLINFVSRFQVLSAVFLHSIYI